MIISTIPFRVLMPCFTSPRYLHSLVEIRRQSNQHPDALWATLALSKSADPRVPFASCQVALASSLQLDPQMIQFPQQQQPEDWHLVLLRRSPLPATQPNPGRYARSHVTASSSRQCPISGWSPRPQGLESCLRELWPLWQSRCAHSLALPLPWTQSPLANWNLWPYPLPATCLPMRDMRLQTPPCSSDLERLCPHAHFRSHAPPDSRRPSSPTRPRP
mmetsp:Transcript_43095/g.99241  ORF Transcript_43095/g.99241 Transcript_43095/m.99241 type:complete len:218 (+) Transcript_43095:127-780(+)